MKYLIILLAGFSFSTASAQTVCPVKRAYAFYTVNMPGTIRVDEQGNQVRPDPMIERVIYLEAAPTLKFLPDSVFYGDRFINGKSERVKGSQVNTGKQKSDGKNFIFQARKGFVLWKIQLETMGEKSGAALNCRRIVIRTRLGTKTCKFYVYRETELEGIPRY